MKDEHGRVTIDGFYDDVVPLTAAEQQAIDEIPDVEPTLMKAFGFTRREDPSSGSSCGTTSRRSTSMPSRPAAASAARDGRSFPRRRARGSMCGSCTASIRRRKFDRIVAHVRKQGYFIVTTSPTPRCGRRIP